MIAQSGAKKLKNVRLAPPTVRAFVTIVDYTFRALYVSNLTWNFG